MFFMLAAIYKQTQNAPRENTQRSKESKPKIPQAKFPKFKVTQDWNNNTN